MTAESPIVAQVGGRVITTAELERRLAAIRGGPLGPRLPKDHTPAGVRLRRWVAQLLASEALVFHEARHTTVPPQAPMAHPVHDSGADPGTQQALTHAARALFDQVTADVTVTEAELRRYYDANPDLWTRPELRTLRQAVRATREEAAALRPDDLAPAETLARGQLSGPLEDALFAAAAGDRIGPVRTVFGWHVAVLDHIERAGTLPYEAVRDTIHTDLLAAARGLAFDDWLAGRRAALVHLSPGYEHPGDPSLPDPVHRH
ncbi:peptidylprolyl isomerase [Streptantibioticus ferralitis]|uniref:Peptidylprolyl isomerase n=1 Tax=Streptantibioticus ferralitis TaxID=236510 RepID=A0ABT5YTQ8_9ACTN|nr:peptidylprolyl isomerase [Streptantibioticus ferralitis]MDF2254900.1 peptidylprolyl isomerase [Streptantibioticus ferralitis]